MTPILIFASVVAFTVGIRVGWTKRAALARAETADLVADAGNATRLLAQALDERQAAIDEAAWWHEKAVRR